MNHWHLCENEPQTGTLLACGSPVQRSSFFYSRFFSAVLLAFIAPATDDFSSGHAAVGCLALEGNGSAPSWTVRGAGNCSDQHGNDKYSISAISLGGTAFKVSG